MAEDKTEAIEGEVLGEDEEIVHPHVDYIPTPHKSRSTDKEGNPDDKLTEKEALREAKEQGIEFVDEYTIEGDEDNVIYETEAEAKAEAGKRNVIQTRRQK